MSVVDASIVARLLQNRREDAGLRAWFEQQRQSLGMPLLTDGRKYAKAPGHMAVIETWP